MSFVRGKTEKEMKRTKPPKKKQTASLILTGDWHLRESQPISRTDDFWQAQWDKVRQIRELQEEHDCPVVMSGDLFHHWKPSPYLLSKTLKNLPKKFYLVAGNHDLPQHNLELIEKSGLQVLIEARPDILLSECHWGQEPDKGSLNQVTFEPANNPPLPGKERKVLVWHVMTYMGKPPWPGCQDLPGHKLLKKYPQFDLILTGHNHMTFATEMDGRWLVNPGSITRQTSDQINHQPCVYLWYREDNSVERKFLEVSDNVISREHITKKEQRDERIAAFVEKLNDDWEGTVSFEENLERFFALNDIKQPVKEIIYEAIDIKK